MAYLIIAALNVLAYFLIPAWWPVILISFIVSFILIKKPGQAFLTGFTASAAVWLFFVLIQTIPNKNILAAKVASTLGVSAAVWPIILSTLLGGLLGGFSSYVGCTIRKLVAKPSTSAAHQPVQSKNKEVLQTY